MEVTNQNNFFSRVICAAKKPKDMDTRKPSTGVSPIIATLLLIAITVAAGVIVYVFVSGTVGNLTQGGGQQTGQQIELTAYVFNPLSGTSACGTLTAATDTAPCIVISFKNTGGSAVTIDSIYINGQLLTAFGTIPAGCSSIAVDGDCNGLGLVATAATGGYGYSGVPTGIVAGSTNTVKIVSATGGLFSFTLTAGSSQ
jgi:flagellin-like protein